MFVAWSVAPTAALLRELYRSLAENADFRSEFDALIDFRAVRAFPSFEETRDIAEQRSAFEPAPGGPFSGRRALVASSDLGYGVARTTASLSQAPPAELRAFRTIREAADWLELPEGYPLPFGT